jgi:hypothetical protein
VTNLILKLLRPVLVPIIVQALCEHDVEVTRRLNHEMRRKPVRDARDPGRRSI